MAEILLSAAVAAPTVQFNPSGALLQSDGYSAPTLACGAPPTAVEPADLADA